MRLGLLCRGVRFHRRWSHRVKLWGIPRGQWRSKWLPRLKPDGLLLGPNRSGPRATGREATPAPAMASVSAREGSSSEPGQSPARSQGRVLRGARAESSSAPRPESSVEPGSSGPCAADSHPCHFSDTISSRANGCLLGTSGVPCARHRPSARRPTPQQPGGGGGTAPDDNDGGPHQLMGPAVVVDQLSVLADVSARGLRGCIRRPSRPDRPEPDRPRCRRSRIQRPGQGTLRPRPGRAPAATSSRG